MAKIRFDEILAQPGAYDDLIPGCHNKAGAFIAGHTNYSCVNAGFTWTEVASSGRPSDGEIYAWAGGALIAGTVLAVVALGLLFRLFRWAAGF
jgi:hypothetical protein